MEDKCKFCERISTEVKDKNLTVKKLRDILNISIEELKNENLEFEFWLDDYMLETPIIGHFNFIPNITFSFKLPKEIETLQQDISKANDKLKKIEEYVKEKSYYTEKITDEESIAYGEELMMYSFSKENMEELLEIIKGDD